MKIQEYFNIQKALHLSDKDKLELYQRILIRQNSKPLLNKRHTFFTKNFVYNFIFSVVFVWIFWYILTQNNVIDYGSFLVKTHNPNEVEAWYIWQVLDFKWDFYIEHNWEIYQSKNISNWDTIILKDNTSIVFDIDKSSKAIIKWPAKLILEKFKKDNKYRITLLEWDFIQMESIDQENIQNIELSVKWENILVKQWGKDKPMNFQLVKQWDKHIVKNNWWDLLISKTDDKSKDQILNKEQILTIQKNDIEVYENLNQFALAIKEKNISQIFIFDLEQNLENTKPNTTLAIQTNNTWTWTQENVTTESYNNEEETLDTILSIDENAPWNPELSKSLSPIISKNQENILSQKVPAEIQIQKLRTSLIWSFLITNLEDIYIYQSLWDTDNLSKWLYRLESKIKQLYTTFWLSYNWNTNISSIKDSINNLISDISMKYYIPPAYIQNLNTLVSWLTNIEKVWFWSQTDAETIKSQWTNLKNKPNLIFKNN